MDESVAVTELPSAHELYDYEAKYTEASPSI